MPIKPEHLDELLAVYEKPEDLLGEGGLFRQLKKALLKRALGAELTHHLGYEKGDPAGRGPATTAMEATPSHLSYFSLQIAELHPEELFLRVYLVDLVLQKGAVE